MAQIKIIVTNKSIKTQNFFFFQEPALYSGGPQVYTNSLYTNTLRPSDQSGAELTFTIVQQYHAGVQEQVSPPQVGRPSGQLGAIQPINLTPASGGAKVSNTTKMSLSDSLGLSVPAWEDGVQPGAFRIKVPQYDPALRIYNAGSAVQTLEGEIVLSNFTMAPPGQDLDCQPIIKFYVATGDYTPGTVMNFTSTSSRAAVCDATQGRTTFNVTYNRDGSWTVNPMVMARLADGSTRLVELV